MSLIEENRRLQQRLDEMTYLAIRANYHIVLLRLDREPTEERLDELMRTHINPTDTRMPINPNLDMGVMNYIAHEAAESLEELIYESSTDVGDMTDVGDSNGDSTDEDLS